MSTKKIIPSTPHGETCACTACLLNQLPESIPAGPLLTRLYVAVRRDPKGTKGFFKTAAKAFEEVPSAGNWLQLKAAMVMHQAAHNSSASDISSRAYLLEDSAP